MGFGWVGGLVKPQLFFLLFGKFSGVFCFLFCYLLLYMFSKKCKVGEMVMSG